MRKPNGFSSKTLDPVLLLYIWAHYLQEQQPSEKKMIYAGIGKPSYLLNEDLALAATNYWQELLEKVAQTKKLITDTTLSPEEKCNWIASTSSAIDYDMPSGVQKAQEMMAQALTKWYSLQEPIDPCSIIFSVGGVSALNLVFGVINQRTPGGKIITPSPYYPFYNNAAHHNHPHFIDLSNEPGYRLTAEALKRSLKQVQEGQKIAAFLFCDPNNPMGYVVGKNEWKAIAEVLKTTSKDIPIIVDEAYAELTFGKKHISLLEVAPELKDRLILLRSATKGFSASGERMAIMLCFNEEIREDLLNATSISYVHAPISLQIAYAQAMLAFTEKKREALSQYYQIQVEYVQKRLKKMNLALPDPSYAVEGTFYVVANLSRLFGTKIPERVADVIDTKGVISTDQEISYALLFQDRMMISPLSFFGANPQLGYVRITCSGGIAELTELLDRLEARL